jgi:formylglycine-generating enzyme required for sulfatase activity/pimeloyl-ACP methyl ester carboxylesterase
MRSSILLLVLFAGCIYNVGLRAAAPEPSGSVKNTLGMKLVPIPPGRFTMGSPVSEVGRELQETPHEVELTKGFSISAHEVTVGQFQQFVKDTKYQTDGERDGKGAYGINEAGKIEDMHAKFTWKSPGFEQTDEHPVVNVSWSDAKAFCKWLSAKEKKSYRLPTEAEWEYACRANTKTAYAHGDDPEGLTTNGNGADATARAKYPRWSIGIKGKDGYVFTAPVGQFKPNAFGLFDMHGNVWEWCEDWYEPNSYPKEKQVDPTGPAKGQAKVQRGGGWSSDAKRLRSAARIGRDPVAYRGCYLGFRVVLETANPKKPTERMEFFEIDGRKAFVIMPEKIDKDKPIRWVGYTPCLLPGLPGGSEDWMFERFLNAGIAVAGIDATDCSGNPESRKLFSKLHEELVKKRNFSLKPALLARSRGGLFAYNWATEHPDQVSCIVGIYPVCNLKSYPGLATAAKHYGTTVADLEKQLDKHSPIERLEPLAKAKVPLFAIHGDADKVVPLEANSGEIEKRYRQLGGTMELIVPKGQGHNFWRGFFECEELVAFVLKHTK